MGVQPTLSVDGILSKTGKGPTFWIVGVQPTSTVDGIISNTGTYLLDVCSARLVSQWDHVTLERDTPTSRWVFSQPCQSMDSHQTLKTDSQTGWVLSQPCHLMGSCQTLEGDSPSGCVFSQLGQLMGLGQTLQRDSHS